MCITDYKLLFYVLLLPDRYFDDFSLYLLDILILNISKFA